MLRCWVNVLIQVYCSRFSSVYTQYLHAGADSSLAGRALVGIIMGSDSDLSTMKAAAEVLHEFEVPYEVTVVSAHRTPLRMVDYGQGAAARGLKVGLPGLCWCLGLELSPCCDLSQD